MGNLVRTITAGAIVLGVAAASGQQQAPAPERPVGMQATLDRLFPGEYLKCLRVGPSGSLRCNK